MAAAKNGDKVRVHYTGMLTDGTVFDSSRDREPLELTLGQGDVIPGFEMAVVGMKPGESRTATVTSDEAYGPHRDDLVMNVDRARIPDHIKPEVGQRLSVTQKDGRDVPVMVTKVSDAEVTLDANHPLAGKDLTFDIELVEIK